MSFLAHFDMKCAFFVLRTVYGRKGMTGLLVELFIFSTI